MGYERNGESYLNEVDEVNCLADEIYSAVNEGDAPEVDVVDRFEYLLQKRGLDDESILLQEYWGLLHAIRGNHDLAVRHRTRHIELIRRLLDDLGPVDSIDFEYLRRSLHALSSSYSGIGEVQKAAQSKLEADAIEPPDGCEGDR
jgi:hypothetical protein